MHKRGATKLLIAAIVALIALLFFVLFQVSTKNETTDKQVQKNQESIQQNKEYIDKVNIKATTNKKDIEILRKAVEQLKKSLGTTSTSVNTSTTKQSSAPSSQAKSKPSTTTSRSELVSSDPIINLQRLNPGFDFVYDSSLSLYKYKKSYITYWKVVPDCAFVRSCL